MSVVVDSWAWIEYFRGSKKGLVAKDYIENQNVQKITSKICVFETYYKTLKEKGNKEAERTSGFMLNASFVEELGMDIIKLAAEIKKEKKLGMADAIVLATAIKNNAPILTGDKDFKNIKEVEIIFLE